MGREQVVVAGVGKPVRWAQGELVRFGKVTAYQASFSGVSGLIVLPLGGIRGDEENWPLAARQVDLTDVGQLKEWLGGSMVKCGDCGNVFRNQRALDVHRASRCRQVRLGLGDVAGVEIDEPLSAGVLVLVQGRVVNQAEDVYARVERLGLCHHGERAYDLRLSDTRVIKDVLEESLTVVDMSDITQLKRWLRDG